MASSSSSLRNWTYHVFASFHGEDVRKTFLSHLRKQFNFNGIMMFDDQGIKRGQTITPELIQGIRESRISIIVLSKNYASSSWCLDELMEILKYREDIGQIVMTVFYGVDTSDVRKQTGEFGIAFKKTCAGKTEEESRRWSQALTDAANIAGVDFKNCKNEAEMIEEIANHVSNQLNVTPSKDFDGMVGLEAHLRELESLLDLDSVGVQMVGIYGPAGIGKSTIARALHSRLSNRFQHNCFVDIQWESFRIGCDDYGLKLRLQENFLSNILDLSGLRISHLGAIKERLCKLRVLIILDDVNHMNQLEALANETTWFGPGSRIIVTTDNKELLHQHGINNTYHVGFPSDEKALKILCRYAFRKSYPHNGVKKLALRVTELCGNLPLALRVVGSSLRGKNEEEWEEVIRGLDSIFDHQDIKEVLRVGYESLHENEQSLFLHISVFFNYRDGDLVTAMLADKNLDVKYGLKILLNRSLIYISNHGEIVMHKLLQQVGTKAVQREKPWKRRILVNAQKICDVLERGKGTREVSGISFDTSGINEVIIKKGAFKRMPNLRFLRVYKSKDDGNDVVYIPEEMEFPRFLRLLDWEAYPSKSLPAKFNPESLVELNLPNNQLEKLWEGPQHLPNLKRLDLRWSYDLKQLPDLSNATNLESLNLHRCESLVEVPSYIGNLHKLEQLDMGFCINLQVVPPLFNLASLDYVDMEGCSQLRNFPDISTNIRALVIADTMLEELPRLITLWSRLQNLSIYGSVRDPLVGRGYIEKVVSDWIKDLPRLKSLQIFGCPKLASLPEIPSSLDTLIANTCESLETLASFPIDSQVTSLYFPNCFKLVQEARKVITQQSLSACLPGRTIPAEFHHRATGNSLTFRPGLIGFRICVVVSPKPEMEEHIRHYSMSRICINGCPTDQHILTGLREIRGEHLCITQFDLSDEEPEKEILLEIITTHQEVDIIECGVQILTDETDRTIRSYESISEQVSADDVENISGGSNEFDELRV